MRAIEFALRSVGADVGTNLIDGHTASVTPVTHVIACRRRHQPDRRTLRARIPCATSSFRADVGTNLIDGHLIVGISGNTLTLVPTSAPT